MKLHAARVQSPSSINTFKQCPRKYFYCYIAKLPTKQNIHTVRGTVMHSVLEDFFDYELDHSSFAGDALIGHALKLFDEKWNESKEKFDALEMDPIEIQHYYEDSKAMTIKWITYFLGRINELSQGDPDKIVDAFNRLKPVQREAKYVSEEYSVMGYIDAVEKIDGKVRVIDYKTSKADKLSPEYKLQLGIYALLYKEKHDVYPDEVGLFLFKHGERMIPVTDELVKNAKFEIENIHMSTQTKDMRDYPKKTTPLCNWCDFQKICFPKN